MQAISEQLGCTDVLQSEALVAGDSVSDWIAFLAGRTGKTERAEHYLQQLWDYVSDQYALQGGLNSVKATQWHRIALTVLALGGDPTSFGTDGSGHRVNLVADGTYNWNMTDSLGTQGLNGWIFALLTLDARQYPVPAGAKFTREAMLDAIIGAQEDDGGFGLTAGLSDLDITAMALQALAPYQEQYPQQISRALSYLASAQTARGDFGSAESCAQVIIALAALGIDPQADARFQKEGGSALSGLLLYQTPSGGFCHLVDEDSDLLATEQGGLALLAVQRLQNSRRSIYDFSDAEIHSFAPKTSGKLLWYYIGAGSIVLGICIAGIITHRRKSCTKSHKK